MHEHKHYKPRLTFQIRCLARHRYISVSDGDLIWNRGIRHQLTHQKRGVIFSLQIFGVILPLFGYSWIDNSYYLISLVRGNFGFEFHQHGTHSTIFNDIVWSDLTSHTCIVLNILLDHYEKVSVTGIGAIKYTICIHKCIDKMFSTYILVCGNSYCKPGIMFNMKFISKLFQTCRSPEPSNIGCCPNGLDL